MGLILLSHTEVYPLVLHRTELDELPTVSSGVS